MVYWIRDIESERVRYVDSFFKRAGLSAPRTAKPIESVRALDRSLSEWIPVTFEPRFETYWHYLMPDGAPSFPDRLAGTNDNDFEELHVSLSLDIALWVVSQLERSSDSNGSFRRSCPGRGTQPAIGIIRLTFPR